MQRPAQLPCRVSGFFNVGSIKSRGEVGMTGGSPHTLAEVLEALRPAPGGPQCRRQAPLSAAACLPQAP